MIDAKITFTKKSVSEYLRFTIFAKSPVQKIITALYVVCCALLIATGIIACLVLNEMSLLLLSVIGIAVMLLYSIGIGVMMNGIAKKIVAANADDKDMSVTLGEDCITVRRSGEPVGVIEYGDVSFFGAGKNAAYMTTGDSALLIIEYSELTFGTEKELRELMEKKNGELKAAKSKK